MVNALAWHFQHRSPAGGTLSGVGREFARPGVVHRLDRQTSGLIIFAKSDEGHWRLGQQFEKRTVDKRYLALVHGLFEPPIDVIDLPLGPHPSKERGYREKYVVRHDALGKTALTIARVRRHFRLPDAAPEAPAAPKGPIRPSSEGWRGGHLDEAEITPIPSFPAGAGGFSLLELELKTGRTHQIRVHLTHRGFPIVADDMYGGKPAAGMSRVALHAATLRFKHPIDGRTMEFQAPLPADFAAAVDTLGNMDKLSTVQSPPGATVRMDGQA
jgi:23S rRNA pseudouridine1911/1915/1917 synthase